MVVIVDLMTNRQLGMFRDQIVTIYRHAFREPPYGKQEHEVVDFARSFPGHVERKGFRLVAAVDEQTSQLVGFAYGHANTPDQWWHKNVVRVMDPRTVADWLPDSFRLVEMAVIPEAQGQGVGRSLHDRLLGGLPYHRAVLSTMAADTTAFRMYCRRGWVVLLDAMCFPGVPRPYRIMGLELGQSLAMNPGLEQSVGG